MTPYSPNLPMISLPAVPGSRFAIINHNATNDEKKTLDFFEQSLQKGIKRFSRSIKSSTEQNKTNTIIPPMIKEIVNTNKIPFMESLSEETTTEEGSGTFTTNSIFTDEEVIEEGSGTFTTNSIFTDEEVIEEGSGAFTTPSNDSDKTTNQTTAFSSCKDVLSKLQELIPNRTNKIRLISKTLEGKDYSTVICNDEPDICTSILDTYKLIENNKEDTINKASEKRKIKKNNSKAFQILNDLLIGQTSVSSHLLEKYLNMFPTFMNPQETDENTIKRLAEQFFTILSRPNIEEISTNTLRNAMHAVFLRSSHLDQIGKNNQQLEKLFPEFNGILKQISPNMTQLMQSTLDSSSTTTQKNSFSTTILSLGSSSEESSITTDKPESTTILSTTTEGIKTTQITTKDAPSFNNFMKNLGITTGIVAFISIVIAFFYKKKNRPITVTSSSNRDKDVEMSLLKKE
ncbi:MAG: hypothetical protein ACRDAI_06215 [Candidatus Rhabdochlamydia sp.]